MPGAVSSKMATLVVVVPLLVLAYFLAPMALPVWRWQHLNDWAAVSKKLGLPEKELKREYKVVMRYNPRGDTDPCPWQIITMDPSWISVDEKHDDETNVLVRCTLISDRDGGPPSKLFLGSGGAAGYKDRYWKGLVWRFPPGAFGFNRARPLVVYRGDAWEHMELGESEALHTDIGGNFGGGKYTNDDDKPDGYKAH